MLEWYSIAPVPVGKTRSCGLFGQTSFHSRNAFTTIGGRGTVRSPDSDLGLPMSL